MQINNSTPVSFGASVKFYMKKKWEPTNVPESFKNKINEVEKMFSEQTKGEKGELGINLIQTGKYLHQTFVEYVGMRCKSIYDKTFWREKADNQTLVDKLKDILKYCKKDLEYNYKIVQKEHELDIAKYNLKKFVVENRYFDKGKEELKKKLSQKEHELLTAKEEYDNFKVEMNCHFGQDTGNVDVNF